MNVPSSSLCKISNRDTIGKCYFYRRSSDRIRPLVRNVQPKKPTGKLMYNSIMIRLITFLFDFCLRVDASSLREVHSNQSFTKTKPFIQVDSIVTELLFYSSFVISRSGKQRLHLSCHRSGHGGLCRSARSRRFIFDRCTSKSFVRSFVG